MECKTLYAGDLLAGRYLIINSLGKGGCGQTYIAEDKQFPGNPKCVVKQFKPQSENPEILDKLKRLFSQESEILSELGKHNQIPNLLANFDENDQFYLVQEWIDGQELTFEMKPGNRFSEHYVISVLYDILEVLEVVHQKGVIHRDIKPSNIMRRKTDGKIVLIDFGAVKEVSQLSTVLGQSVQPHTISIGTPGFMPSEQRAGTPKLSSDIYAVGMLGIQALTGITPSELPIDLESGEVIWHEQIFVSGTLENILDKMVRYDFRQRYPNATKTKEALHSLRFNVSDPVPPTNIKLPNVFMAKPFQEPVSPEQPSTILNPNHSSPQSKSPKRRGIPFRAFGWGLMIGLIGGVAGTLYFQFSFMPHIFSNSHSKSSELSETTTDSGAPSPSPSSEVSPVISPNPVPAIPALSPSPIVKPAAVVDYNQLKTALTAGQWKVADQLTRDLVLSLTGRSGSILRVEDVEQIPCSDIKTLGQLWEQSSQGRFGFKAQQKVWQNVVGKSSETVNVESGNTNDKLLTAFATKIGWVQNSYGSWNSYRYGELTFALNAPVGHLPAKALLPEDSPNDTTQRMRDAAVLTPSLAQRVTFCESKR